MEVSKAAIRAVLCGALGLVLQVPGTATASHVLSGINMHGCELVLVHGETDQMAKVSLPTLYGWNPASCQHTAISADEKTVYVTTDAVPPHNASVVTVRINKVDWSSGTINASILQTLQLDPSGSPAKLPQVTQVAANQPIMPWSRPAYTQTHGPTFLPGTNFFYVTHYTDDRIRGFQIKTDGTLEQKVLYQNTPLTRQTHGVNFNNAGTVGLGVGYDYDMPDVRVYRVNPNTGQLYVARTIRLGQGSAYGAFAHYASWLNDRYAYVGTMQSGPTSATPSGAQIIEPSVWLVDVALGTAKRVIGSASSYRAGLLRSPSDVAVAKGKLYVAEEDSWGKRPNAPAGDYGRDGYVSVWDISRPDQPRFLKRLAPGAGLPVGFRNAHTLSSLKDESAVYVSSFISNHLIKIDTATDTVKKVYGMEDGLHMYHGEFAAGRNR